MMRKISYESLKMIGMIFLKMKKKKDDDVLDFQENYFEDDKATHTEQKDKLLKYLKKTLRITVISEIWHATLERSRKMV